MIFMKERVWLSQKRIELGLTLLEAAKLVGLSKQGYWFIETGKRNPSVKTAKKIADKFNLDWTKFF
ncbi:TPA: helix-turn-helix transcriptional regulator [Enterococcus faecalis]|nr:helix-turn-helix transcriptional regulator [Enterococcus faecalis]HBI1674274.1 helix-turn-helix transcriptional regulator [Enterococcus faecalis]HBI1676904.1 helix-turn-helix transcriptional regulator [Enterococcus faecalis]HBI1679494.1 helix-turn-helix transcriptional regulator [Enterococcus faecalis]HBI1682798.1 helix-turn-helix transcriptional regulator [Enterococcus faecalis]